MIAGWCPEHGTRPCGRDRGNIVCDLCDEILLWVEEANDPTKHQPEDPMDVIEVENDLQGAADLFDVPRELMGDAERQTRIRRLRREADEKGER